MRLKVRCFLNQMKWRLRYPLYNIFLSNDKGARELAYSVDTDAYRYFRKNEVLLRRDQNEILNIVLDEQVKDVCITNFRLWIVRRYLIKDNNRLFRRQMRQDRRYSRERRVTLYWGKEDEN